MEMKANISFKEHLFEANLDLKGEKAEVIAQINLFYENTQKLYDAFKDKAIKIQGIVSRGKYKC